MALELRMRVPLRAMIQKFAMKHFPSNSSAQINDIAFDMADSIVDALISNEMWNLKDIKAKEPDKSFDSCSINRRHTFPLIH